MLHGEIPRDHERHEPRKKPTVFISYSHRDDQWKSRILAHLELVGQPDSYDVWSDRVIEAGADWFEQIRRSISSASVALLLISPNYLASEFILNEEVSRLLVQSSKKELLLIPIIVKPCDWESLNWLRQIQVFPEDGKPLSLKTSDDVVRSLDELAGRIRSNLVEGGRGEAARSSDVRVSVGRLPAAGTRLFGRERELEALDEAWDRSDTKVLTLLGAGGVGKSALVGHWLSLLARDDYRGARRVYGWSFYHGAGEQKAASADIFIDSALRWFGDLDPAQGSPWDKGERLAHIVGEQRTLLVLDGLEILQHGSGWQEGALKEQSLQALLRGLAADSRGMCLITSRAPVRGLEEFEGSSSRELRLHALTPEAGARVLRSLGVSGEEQELERASAEFGGNVLALKLLASYLVEVHSGDVGGRAGLKALAADSFQERSEERILASYVKLLGEGPELNVLRILGLTDRPVDRKTLEALRVEPAIRGLTDSLQGLSEAEWRQVLSRLRGAGLLGEPAPDTPDALDAHPLVREFFRGDLKRNYLDAWREGNKRLYEYLKSTAREFPDTVEEMDVLYTAVTHGCRADLYQDALLKLYWPRIQRGREFFNTNKLGAYGADLTVLSNFFRKPWTSPVEQLDEPWKAFVMNAAGFDLLAAGRPTEATEPMRAGVEWSIELGDWHNAAVGARNLSDTYQTIGELTAALKYAQQSVELADIGGSFPNRVISRSSLGSALHQCLMLEEAEEAFREAERIQFESQPEFPVLYSVRGYEFCDLLLTRGQYADALARTRQNLEIAQRNLQLLDISLHHLLIGRALMMQAQAEGGTDSDAGGHLRDAVDGLRLAGRLDYLSLGLLGRAEFAIAAGNFDAAEEDIREAKNIAERGSMGLRSADCQLLLAKLNLAKDEKDRARGHWRSAIAMVESMGYRRRVGELEKVGAQL
jgi:tetratricopeptide (TPR) repeat protein